MVSERIKKQSVPRFTTIAASSTSSPTALPPATYHRLRHPAAAATAEYRQGGKSPPATQDEYRTHAYAYAIRTHHAYA